MCDGQIYHIDFSGNKGSEINSIHLGIIFTMPNVKNMIFCLPLTSPKEKHFKDKESFKNRNHNELRYQNLIYIDQTDSIALLDQIRSISINRLLSAYKDNNDNIVILNEYNIKIINVKLIKYLKHILKKDTL